MFGPYFFLSSILQSPCVCFCVLGRAALTPCLSSVAYFRKGTCKLCRVEPSIIARAGLPASPLFGSVQGKGSERRQCHCLASGALPNTCSVSSHFTCSLHATSALPTVALVLNPRVGGSTQMLSPCRPFKQSLLNIQQFLLLPQLPLVFTARIWGFIFLSLESWAVWFGLWLGSLTPEVSL